MPRYYLNLFDPDPVYDNCGTDVPDLAGAIIAAEAAIRDVVAFDIREGRAIYGSYSIEIIDSARRFLHKISFAEVVVVHDFSAMSA